MTIENLTFDEQKELFRYGIPDSHKRRIIQRYFKLNPKQCNYDYEAVKNSAGKEFLEFTAELKLVTKHLFYDFLTELGRSELEFILMYLHSKLGVQRIQFVAHIGNILMIYLPPAEVYQVLMQLVNQTYRIKKDPKENGRLRWFLPHDANDHAQLISTFIDMFMEDTKQQVLFDKCYELELNFDIIINSLLNSMLTSVLSLDQSIHICFNFLFEG